ADYLQLTRA
uniref:Extended FMRFamide-2 n=1 Tax=Praedatophasma maraisi TaxID=409170 RepID=FAR2_PRAMA|nr:RecName: Full=Extended FMRFamide-2; Short=FMRFa-2 [Praedatophasma maraisi]